jgi:hypothetical protein
MLLGALLLLAGAAPLAVRAYDDVVAWGGGLWPGAGEILLLLLGVAVVAAARLLPRARTGRDTR